MGEPLNAYGLPITSPEYFDGEHAANPTSAGLPPVCSCGWTPHGEFTMADHLADMAGAATAARLEYLRGELRAERISYGELLELQGLADEIDPGDVELLEAAGVEEFPGEEHDAAL